MRRRGVLGLAVGLLLTVTATGCSASSTPADAASATPTPKLVWSDEFDGASGIQPDAWKWEYETGGYGWGNLELECYTDAAGNASQNGSGSLVIRAIKQPGHRCSDGRSNDYTSARITTKNSFSTTYGTLEVRAKLPAGTGTWPAFWALGSAIDTVGWPKAGEIDVLEAKGGHPQSVYASVHSPKADDSPMYVTDSLNTGVDLSAGFHTYAVNWSATEMTYLFDGSPYSVITKLQVQQQGGTWVFDKPFYLLLNLAVGGKFTVAPTSDFGLSQQYVIDYVRVFD